MWLLSGPHPKATETNRFTKGSEPAVIDSASIHAFFIQHVLLL